MKLFLGQKRKRQLIFGLAAVSCGILLWWAQIYEPLKEQRHDLTSEMSRLSQDRTKLNEKLRTLSEFIETHKAAENELTRFDALKIAGKTLEELNASTQAILQQYLEKNSITIKAYKDLPGGKWREHPISRIELQIETRMQGISDLLEYLEKLNKVIRIERFTVFYRRMKDSDLIVTLQLAVLQMDSIKP